MRSIEDILTDIRQHPERDDLRLEYADACELKDPAYAKYIRREVAETRPTTEYEKWPHHKQLRDRIAHPFLSTCYSVAFRRGFIEEITIDPYVFIDRGGELLDRAPIQRVVFMPKLTPPHLATPLLRTVVPSPVPEIMACPHLGRLYSIDFQNTHYQRWWAGRDDIESVLASNNLARLVDFSLPDVDGHWKWTEEQTHDVWERAFARPEFRKMLSIDFLRSPGESVESHEEGLERVEQPVAMTDFGRDLERRHGYLPALHLHNSWGILWLSARLRPVELISAAQRGELPRFPVGAPASPVMYVLPPAKRVSTGNNW